VASSGSHFGRSFAALAVVLAGSLVACLPSVLLGRVSSAVYREASRGASFVVVTPTSGTLTDRNIGTLISRELESRGFSPAPSAGSADLAAAFSYSIGSGTVQVSGHTNSVTGKTNVSSATEYPRYFEVRLIDLHSPDISAPQAITWQAEVYSEGSSANMSLLSEYFVTEAFRHFGETVKDQRFREVIHR
jgi:hypothetical protein